MRALDEAGCLVPNSPGVMEVRRIWLSREGLAADAAGRDPVVQAFMANCLVESIRDVSAVGPVEASAISHLRQALNEPSRGLEGIAMTGLAGILVKEDVATIVRLGSTQSTLAIPAIAALSISCLPEAKAGVASIRAVYVRAQPGVEIERFIAGSKELMEHCEHSNGSSPRTFTAEALITRSDSGVPRSGSPDAAHVRSALESPKDKSALQTLLDVQCTADHADAVDEMRRAWRGRDTLDLVVQAVIARCLVEVDSLVSAQKSEVREAAVVLRSAIHDSNAMAVVAAVEGLAIIGADEDVERIAAVPRRLPGSLNWTIRMVGFRCGANNLRTLALIRKRAATDQVRDQIDAVYKHVRPVREQTCGKGK
jgi:hypothetical protein